MTKSLSVFHRHKHRDKPPSRGILSTQPQHKRASIRPTRGLPSSYPVFFVFSFVYAGFRGLRAPGWGILQGARVQKKPYAVGVPQHKASLVCYVVWGLRDGRGDAQLSCLKLSLSRSMRVGMYRILRIIRTLKPDSISNSFEFYEIYVFDF